MNEGTREGLHLRWQWLILLASVGVVLYLLAPVLMPFVAAALFAYLADPIVDRLERWMGRGLAFFTVLAGIGTLVIVLYGNLR